jgi:MacB-like periplasmic core domain
MTFYSGPVFHTVDRGLLSCASLLVPGRQRAEWRLEWESELWHARRSNDASGMGSWRAEREIADFCFGAFQDAACLRRLSWQNRPRFAPLHGSAIQCLFWLTSLLFVSYLCSLLSPGVRAEHDFTSTQVRPGTILIEDEEAYDNAGPTMAIDQVRIWERSRQRYADGFAFYRVAKEIVQPGAHETDTWRIAQASSNLFAVAGWSLRSMAPDEETRSDMPRLVLSERIWRQRFGANPEILGTVLLVGARRARVVGIAPGDTWRLPGNSDAWLLESDSEVGRNGRGYVIAHLTPRGRSEMYGGVVPITSYDSQKAEHAFLGRSLEEQQPGPWSIYWFGVLLALLALPAIASVSLAEYSFSSQKPSRGRKAVRFGFFGTKITLILSIAYFSSIDLAYWHFPALSPAGAYIQLSVSFAILLFGLRWALLDQRERCPVCLRRVTHPAQVGSFSSMFLAWSGTELICTGGHTLLHVPGLPTSWFSAQRWTYLDSSWDFLFASQG